MLQRLLSAWALAGLALMAPARQASPAEAEWSGSQDWRAADWREADGTWSAQPGATSPEAGAGSAAAALPPLRVSRGANAMPLLIPREERLHYDVNLSFGWLGSPRVGTVELNSTVAPFRENLLSLEEESSTGKEKGTIEAIARGSYSLYEVTDTISTTILPQRWPNAIYRNVQTGTENRRREIMLGLKDGEFSGQYRRDEHCGKCEDLHHFVKPKWAWQSEHHCKKCRRAEHRVWHPPETRTTPPDSVDMLSAVYLMRSMIQTGEDALEFHILDKQTLWKVHIERGQTGIFDLPAGKFAGVEVRLRTEPMDAKTKKDKFSGLFGIHGSISVYMHPASGVPILISGEVPAGPIQLDVAISLADYRGTPASFRPVGSGPAEAATRTRR